MGKGRAPCCDKGRVNKGPWSQEEDLKLITFIQRYGHNNWRSLPKLAGLARCGKSCRLRWVNYLRPDLKRGNFTSDEEETIIRLQSLMGNKWSKIASHLPGRTDNEIKNVWNTHLKKRLRNSSLDSKSALLIQTSTDNGTVELSSSDCSADDCSNHDVTNVTQTASSPTVDDGKNTNELLEIPYDEANTVDVWDSLLMLDVGTAYTRSNSSIDIISEMEVENSFGWQLGLLDSHEEQGMINMDSDSRTNAINGDKEKSKCEQVEGLAASHSNEGLLKVDNMESYLEVMAWPTSPTYDSYLGF